MLADDLRPAIAELEIEPAAGPLPLLTPTGLARIRLICRDGHARSLAQESAAARLRVGQPDCRAYPSCSWPWAHEAQEVDLAGEGTEDGEVPGAGPMHIDAASGSLRCPHLEAADAHRDSAPDCPRNRASAGQAASAVAEAVEREMGFLPADLASARSDHRGQVTREAVAWARGAGRHGRCLVLSGLEGRGKSCAAAVAARLLAQHRGAHGQGCAVRYGREDALLTGLAGADPGPREDELRLLCSVDVLVLDECGGVERTTRGQEWFLRVLSEREAAARPTILATRSKVLPETLDPQLRSRLARWADTVAATGEDLRRASRRDEAAGDDR